MRLAAALLLMGAQLMAAQTRGMPQFADQIFLHGNIYTGADQGLDGAPAQVSARVEALAVRAGRIVAAGSDPQISRLKGPATEVVDLGGRFVMPGFNDAHLHLANAGLEKLNVDLVGTRSLEEMKERIVARARTAAPGEWIAGGGWDQTTWAREVLPTRRDLDAVTGDHPAYFVRVDGHILVADSAALKAAGITRETANPAGGQIDRDAQGEPTGILRESAQALVRKKQPPPAHEQRRRALELALADAARWGVTSAQDNSQWEDFLVFEQMESEGKLTLRISEWLDFKQPLQVLEQQRAHHPKDDPLLTTGMLKGFMDGSLGSRTAALLAPYADDPQNTGLPQYRQDELNRMAAERARAGFQMGFHAIGDGGVETALEAFALAGKALGGNATGRRFRIEHAQITTPEQIARFRQLGVIASMQPNHLLTDMHWAEQRIGAERAKHSYAWAEFLRAGVPLAFGTDYPVEPITPFRGLYAAVTRKNEAGTQEYFPEQKISIDEAIAAYTTGAAYAEFAEHQKGKLEPGMLADFVVLDRDITRVPPAEILGTQVMRTVVGGKTVYGK